MCFISDSLKVLTLHSLSPLSEYSSLRQRDDLPQASQVGLSKSQHGLGLVVRSTASGSGWEPTSSTSGNVLVNQPTVRERSTSANSACRPCPSSSMASPGLPKQSQQASARALSSTSSTLARVRWGTSRSKACVSSRPKCCSMVCIQLSLLAPVGLSTGKAGAELLCCSQKSASCCMASLCT